MTTSFITLERDRRGAIACLVLFVVGGVILLASRDYTALGSVFPRTMAILMMALSLLYVVQVMRRPRPVEFETGGANGRRLLMFAIMLAWAFGFERLGFLTTSLIAYALALMVANFNPWSPRDIVLYFGSGAAVVIGLYLLFRHVLQVPLPVGLFL